MVMMTLFLDISRANGEEDITINSNTTWSAGTYTYRDILITNNATLTLQGSYTDDNDGFGVTINARNISIDTGSTISANAQGYARDAGPGKGYTGTSSYGSGGAYGGNGAAAALNNILQENTSRYDEAFRPTKLGSGGALAAGGSGGGAIIINCSELVTVNGTVSANGQNAPGAKGGGGSGGTVSIDAGSVVGGGSISAIGGNGIANSGSGGGGGRVSVYYSDTYSVNPANVSVAGGTGFSGRNGDIGTVIIFNDITRKLSVEKTLTLYKNEGLNQSGEPSSDGNYYFGDLEITNNATLYPQSTYTDNNDGAGIKFYLSGDLTVNSGSSINGVGTGYTYDSGPGVGTGTTLKGGGGGHGGAGGDGDVHAGGPSYGLTMLPVTLGSGGYSPGGGSGGGAVYIDCGGDITLNGNIDVSGNDGFASGSARGGGGSGGSVFIRSDTITGSASILSEGGNGLQYSGGGAGGRIAIYSDTTSFPPSQISAAGGSAGGSGGSKPGQTGTIFIYDIGTGDVTASNDVTFEATQGLSPDGSFRDDGIYYFNNFTVSDGATVTIGSSYSDENNGRGVTLNISGNLTVESGSKISANEQGLPGSTGNGKGFGSGSQSGSGASYGGLGGPSYNPVSPGVVYGEDSANYPYMLGSGGGAGHSGGVGGNGGGAITLRVLGGVTIDGTISANGGQGSGGFSSWRPGGGSGGSIFIVCDSISGSGLITANGGDGMGTESFSSGAGGGGRISLVYQTSLLIPLDNITSSGGTGAVESANGSNGTVRTENRVLPSSTFNLKNPNNNSTQYTNTPDVTIEPAEEKVDQYSEFGAQVNLVPPFYDSSWEDVETGLSLSEGEGEKTVKAWLKDTNQLISSQVGQATIIVDLTKPSISIDDIEEETNESSVLIKGNLSDALSGIERAVISATQAQSLTKTKNTALQTLSNELTIDESGDFEIELDLSSGENNIVITGYDRAGNENSQTFSIFYSQPASTVSPVTSPSASATPNAAGGVAQTASTQTSTNESSLSTINAGMDILQAEESEYEGYTEPSATLTEQESPSPNSSDKADRTSSRNSRLWLLIILSLLIIGFLAIFVTKKRKRRRS